MFRISLLNNNNNNNNNNNVYFSLKYKLLSMRKIGMNWGTYFTMVDLKCSP